MVTILLNSVESTHMEMPDWCLSPRRYVANIAGLLSTLVGLKTFQRMIEDGMGFYQALWNAVVTRIGNNSTYVLLSYAVTIWAISFFAQRKLRSSHSRSRQMSWVSITLVIMLTLLFWALYFDKIWSAPDPGTFASHYTGSLYALQFAEGCINLFELALAALWVVLSFQVVRDTSPSLRPNGDWPDRCLVFQLLLCCCIPVLILGLACWILGWGWLVQHWQVGNHYPALLGYNLSALAIYAALAAYICYRHADSLSVFEFIKFLRDVIKGKGDASGK